MTPTVINYNIQQALSQLDFTDTDFVHEIVVLCEDVEVGMDTSEAKDCPTLTLARSTSYPAWCLLPSPTEPMSLHPTAVRMQRETTKGMSSLCIV